jgi:RNA polymerase sigma-70 factor (ECF subfamily)
MPLVAPPAVTPVDDDVSLARRIGSADHAAFEVLMRRYNSRLFRIARAILKNDAEAEDALQESYLEAYLHIDAFRGDAELSTWLTRIVVNRALMKLRKEKRHGNVVAIGGSQPENGPAAEIADTKAESPRDAAFRSEVRKMLERRIDELPLSFRAVFVMREVEDMTVQETAACLSIPEATVRSRLFRARALLRESLARDLDMASADAFAFAGARCDRIVATVLASLPPR